MPTEETDWAIALFRRSVLKQKKLDEITRLLGATEGLRCLDLGSDNGVVSLLLRRRGGRWASADMTQESIDAIRSLVHDDVHRSDGAPLPFADGEFDRVVVVDMLEHVADDRAFTRELARITRPGGRLVVNTPHRRDTPLRRLRHALGQTDEKHGHVRAGYTIEDLRTLLAADFKMQDHRTYSRFFSECVDTLIQWGLERLGKKGGSKGLVVTRSDIQRHRRLFRIYSLMYPLVWLLSSLDRLIPWWPGYMLIASAVRRST